VKVNVLEVYVKREVWKTFPQSGVGWRREAPDAAALEERLQVWLKDNPSAQIEHVVQTPVSQSDGNTDYLLVTIFYRD
jgi:hypothetical protein